MSKLLKSMLITFAVGLAFIGIGSGIAFAEFSGVRYMGAKDLQNVAYEEVTDTFEYKLPNTNDYINVSCMNTFRSTTDGQQRVSIVADPTLNNNDIFFEVKYARNTNISIGQNTNYENDREIRTSEFYVSVYDDSAAIFNYWGEMVEDLKRKEIYDYSNAYQGSLTIKVAPGMTEKVILN